MDFLDRLNQVTERVTRLADRLDDESADPAKHALVVPFLEALGYDPQDPSAVVPAFSAGSARVDYALCPDGSPAVLLACRPPGAGLSVDSSAPLSRAARASEVPLAAITNGTQYRFFARRTDGPALTPFFTVRLDDLDRRDVDVLRALRRDAFAPDTMVHRASRPTPVPSSQDDDVRAVVHHLSAAVRAFLSAPTAVQDRLRPVVQIVARHLVRGEPSRPMAAAVADQDDVADSTEALLRLIDERTGAGAPDEASDALSEPEDERPHDSETTDRLIATVKQRLKATHEPPSSDDAPSTERLVRRLEQRLSS